MSFPKIREITLNLLNKCGIDSPPVPIEPLLTLFNATLADSGHIQHSALLRVKNGWQITVNRNFREERRCFRIAHEMAHIYWSSPEHHLGDPTLGGRLEQYCSKFASLLLCPHQWFIQDAPEADYDLFTLKSIYSNVSHEVLAFRLSYCTQMVVTILDNGKLYRRFCSPGLVCTNQAQVPEKKVYEEVDLYGDSRSAEAELSWSGRKRAVKVKGYPVFSGNFRRIILLTTPITPGTLEEKEFEEDMPYPFPEY